jgi:hypothetical protein
MKTGYQEGEIFMRKQATALLLWSIAKMCFPFRDDPLVKEHDNDQNEQQKVKPAPGMRSERCNQMTQIKGIGKYEEQGRHSDCDTFGQDKLDKCENTAQLPREKEWNKNETRSLVDKSQNNQRHLSCQVDSEPPGEADIARRRRKFFSRFLRFGFPGLRCSIRPRDDAGERRPK